MIRLAWDKEISCAEEIRQIKFGVADLTGIVRATILH